VGIDVGSQEMRVCYNHECTSIPYTKEANLKQLLGNTDRVKTLTQSLVVEVSAILQSVQETLQVVADIVVVCLPYYNLDADNVLKGAAQTVGISTLRIVTRGVACHLAYYYLESFTDAKQIVLFINFGRSMELQLYEVEDQMYDKIGSLVVCGATSFAIDELLANYVVKQVKTLYNVDLEVSQQLLDACSKAKHGLSKATRVFIDINPCESPDQVEHDRQKVSTQYDHNQKEVSKHNDQGFSKDELSKDEGSKTSSSKPGQVGVDRSEFDALIDGFVNNIVQKSICQFLAQHEMTSVDKVLLAGRSSQICAFRNMLDDLFGRTIVCYTIDPANVKAMGAELQARCLGRRDVFVSDTCISPLEVARLPLGIKQGDDMLCFIPKNSVLTAKKVLWFIKADCEALHEIQVVEGCSSRFVNVGKLIFHTLGLYSGGMIRITLELNGEKLRVVAYDAMLDFETQTCFELPKLSEAEIEALQVEEEEEEAREEEVREEEEEEDDAATLDTKDTKYTNTQHSKHTIRGVESTDVGDQVLLRASEHDKHAKHANVCDALLGLSCTPFSLGIQTKKESKTLIERYSSYPLEKRTTLTTDAETLKLGIVFNNDGEIGCLHLHLAPNSTSPTSTVQVSFVLDACGDLVVTASHAAKKHIKRISSKTLDCHSYHSTATTLASKQTK
jgi:molecular chaperone DnaK (HSP70)